VPPAIRAAHRGLPEPRGQLPYVHRYPSSCSCSWSSRQRISAGASSGIGEATARALAASGFRLGLLARRLDRIQALASELGNGAIAIQADVTDRDSLVAAASRVKTELGGTDILVNNAGIMLLAPFTPEGHDDHRRVLFSTIVRTK
jgi:NADP-dependent 3-hydroxy acid dehydrogenase YdfG